MSRWPPAAAIAATKVADQLDRAGVACLTDVIAPPAIAAAHRELTPLVEQYGRGQFTVLDVERHSDLAVSRLATDPHLNSLVTDLIDIACPRGEWPDRRDAVQTSFNVTVTSDQPSPRGNLHYDASIVTMVIPLLIPRRESGLSGELVMFPNRRPFRPSVLRDVVEKVRDQNGPTATRMWDRACRQVEGDTLALRAGNAYVFWGYRTLHGSLPCGPGCVRATLTIFGGNPHGRHPALRLLKRANDFRAARGGLRRI